MAFFSISSTQAADDDDILDMIPAIVATQVPTATVMDIVEEEPEKQKKRSGTRFYSLPSDYKACAVKIDYWSRNPNNSDTWVSVAKVAGGINLSYNVPCGGGGVESGPTNQVVGTVVGALAVAYFGGAGTTIAGWLMNKLIENGTSTIVSTILNAQERSCGYGDRRSWLKAYIHLFLVRNDLNCPIADAGYSAL